jgi:hypothetical protein
MNLLLSLAAEFVGLAVVCAIINIAILVARNPLRPAILKRHIVEDGIAALCILAAFVAVTMLGYGIFSLLPNLYAGGTVFLVASVLTYVVIDRAMGMKALIDACDQGRSPFVRASAPQSTLAVS